MIQQSFDTQVTQTLECIKKLQPPVADGTAAMSFTKGLVRAYVKVTRELRIAVEEPEEEVKVDIEEHTVMKKAIEKILLALLKISA